MGVYNYIRGDERMEDAMEKTEEIINGCGCCGERTKERGAEEYKSLVNRLNRIEGQIRGIRGMVERSAYCPDILVQSAAVTAAIRAFNRELLVNHIRSCVVDDIRRGDEAVVDELVDLLPKLMK